MKKRIVLSLFSIVLFGALASYMAKYPAGINRSPLFVLIPLSAMAGICELKFSDTVLIIIFLSLQFSFAALLGDITIAGISLQVLSLVVPSALVASIGYLISGFNE